MVSLSERERKIRLSELNVLCMIQDNTLFNMSNIRAEVVQQAERLLNSIDHHSRCGDVNATSSFRKRKVELHPPYWLATQCRLLKEIRKILQESTKKPQKGSHKLIIFGDL